MHVRLRFVEGENHSCKTTKCFDLMDDISIFIFTHIISPILLPGSLRARP